MRVAIFDLDGTLADSAPDLVGAAFTVMAARGAEPPPFSAVRRHAGAGGRALLTAAYDEIGAPKTPDAIEAMIPDFLVAYETRIAEKTRLFPGVEGALDALQASGWRLAVCTNKPERLATLLLDALGAGRWFGPALVGADTLPVRKPDPAPLWEAARRAGADPDEAAWRAGAVMIGDTMTDMRTARAAGVPSVLTRHGYALQPEEALAPDAAVDHAAALPAALDALRPAAP